MAKALRKALKRLERRVKEFESIKNKNGFTKPGSMKKRSV